MTHHVTNHMNNFTNGRHFKRQLTSGIIITCDRNSRRFYCSLAFGFIFFANLCLLPYLLFYSTVVIETDSNKLPSTGSPAASTVGGTKMPPSNQFLLDEQRSVRSGSGLKSGLGIGLKNHLDCDNEKRRFRFGCPNIDGITIKRKLGHGVSKQVYLGLYKGEKMAVKMVTRNLMDVTRCLKRKETLDAAAAAAAGASQPLTLNDAGTIRSNPAECHILPNMKLMKEILILNQLEHPNLLRLLGYCVRSEETDSTSLQDHGVIALSLIHI